MNKNIIEKFFPYPSFRRGQREIAEAVFDVIENGGHVIIEGPSGLGKTAAVLAGAMPHVVDSEIRVLFLARTHRELDRVIDELRLINNLTQVSGASIRGKLEMCINKVIIEGSPDHKTHAEICSMAIKEGKCEFYNNLYKKDKLVNNFMKEAKQIPVKANEVYEICLKYKICPYEVMRSLLSTSQVIAASYMYLINPYIYKNFQKDLGGILEDFLVVIDEAHNLPDFSISALSDSITLRSVKSAMKEAEKYHLNEVKKFAKTLYDFMYDLGAGLEEEGIIKADTIGLIEDIESEFGMTFVAIADVCRYYGKRIKQELLMMNKTPKSYIYKLGEFSTKLYETLGLESFIHVLSKTNGKLQFEIISLDPREVTEPIFRNARATVSMSGTLKPFEAYVDLVGIKDTTTFIDAPSPFKSTNILTLVIRGVTTKYESRNKRAFMEINRLVCEVVENTPGNTGVFVASYDVLEGMINAGIESMLTKPVFIERKDMTSKENDKMISQFKSMCENGGAVLLSVQGGRNAEGEDYPGRQMSSVVIVGIPFARPNVRVNAQIKYYDKVFPGKGRFYGYILPAVRKSSQAAGRPFRSLEDKGIIVLADRRFLWKTIRDSLPKWIKVNFRILDGKPGQIARIVKNFYAS